MLSPVVPRLGEFSVVQMDAVTLVGAVATVRKCTRIESRP